MPRRVSPAWLKSTTGLVVDPDTIFDSQVNASTNTSGSCSMRCASSFFITACGKTQARMAPRTFLFAGKAAPAYVLAKLIVKFINNLAEVIDDDPACAAGSKWCFCPTTTFPSPST